MFNAEGSFARKQLEKHGWTEGSGLGTSQQGISQAIKVKIKHDTTGVGHELGKEFSDFWWERAYNKAVANLIVEKVQDGVVIKKKSTTKKERTEAARNSLYGNFIKGSLLTNGTETAIEKERGDSDSSEDETTQQTPTFLLPDEELLRRCGGRTFHPAARHGMKLTGKLARLAEHDRLYTQKHPNSPSSPLTPQSSQNGVTACSPCPPENLSDTKQQKKCKEGARKERDGELHAERKVRGQVSASEEEQILEQPEDTATISKKKKKKKKKKRKERRENESDITTESSSVCPLVADDDSRRKKRKERDDALHRESEDRHQVREDRPVQERQKHGEQPEDGASVSRKKKKKKKKARTESSSH